MKIKKEKYAYLAGAIDCDGCIGINKTTRRSTKINKKNPIYNLYVRIVQKDKRILRFCYKTFGGHLYRHNQIFWEWHILGSYARNLLEMILPFLIYKKKQAKAAIEFDKMRQRQTKKWLTDRARCSSGKKYFLKGSLSKEVIQKREKYYQKLKDLKKEIK